MDVRDLEYFLAVADELHFGRAAARLHIVPAAVSTRIRDLEVELGVSLCARKSRKVALTPAGSRLIGPARTVLQDLRRVRDLASSLARGAHGNARVSLAPNLGAIGMRFVTALVDALPELEAVGESSWGAEAIAAVETGEASAAVVRGPVERRGLTVVPIGRYADSFVAVADTDPVAASDQVPPETFECRAFLVNERVLAPVLHDRTVGFFAEHGVAPLWRHHRMQSIEQVMSFVGAGYAAALVHSHLAELTFPGVAVRPMTHPGPGYDVVVIWRSEDASVVTREVAAVAQRLSHQFRDDHSSTLNE